MIPTGPGRLFPPTGGYTLRDRGLDVCIYDPSGLLVDCFRNRHKAQDALDAILVRQKAASATSAASARQAALDSELSAFYDRIGLRKSTSPALEALSATLTRLVRRRGG